MEELIETEAVTPENKRWCCFCKHYIPVGTVVRIDIVDLGFFVDEAHQEFADDCCDKFRDPVDYYPNPCSVVRADENLCGSSGKCYIDCASDRDDCDRIDRASDRYQRLSPTLRGLEYWKEHRKPLVIDHREPPKPARRSWWRRLLGE